MANPELLIYSALRAMFTKKLSKGRWMLQRIETSTGVGIPDCYCSLPGMSLWIETKTVNYRVSNEQLNWAHQHALTGGLTYIVTRVIMPPIAAKTAIKHAPTTAYNPPPATSNLLPHTTTYPTLLKLVDGTLDNLIVPYCDVSGTCSRNKKGQDTLIFLAFDERMRDCSTLGSYLNRYNPDVLLVEHMLDHLC